MWGLHTVLYSIYRRSLGIKQSRPEPKNTTVSRALVMMHNTKFPLVLRFQLNKEQYMKSVRVSGTEMYGKEWAGGSSNWYSAVGEG